LRSTGSFTTAGGGKVDVERSLSYGEYFFVEAMLRYKDIYGSTPRAPRSSPEPAHEQHRVDLDRDAWCGQLRGETRWQRDRAFSTIGTTSDPRYTDSTATAGQSFFYVVTATNLAPAESAASNVASFPVSVSGFSDADVGSVAAAGSSSLSSGTYTVRGSGADIGAPPTHSTTCTSRSPATAP